MKVNNRTRATYKGREICCPHCETINTVYHFNWSAIQCDKCKLMVDKKEWDLVDKKQIDEKEFEKFEDALILQSRQHRKELLLLLKCMMIYINRKNKTKKIKKSKKVKI